MVAMPKVVRAKVASVSKLNINVRFDNNLDIEGMSAQIVAENGQVLEPVHAWMPTKEQAEELNILLNTLVILRGYRRVGGLMYIGARRNEYSAEICDAAETFPCIIHENMSFAEAKMFVFDHSDQRPLSGAEVIRCVFQLFAEGKSEADVATELYPLLYRAFMTDGQLKEVEKIQNYGERMNFVKKALHNRLYKWLQRAVNYGPWIRDQVQLFQKYLDGLLATGEVVYFKAHIGAMEELAKARKLDEETVATGADGVAYIPGWKPVLDVQVTDDGIVVDGGGVAFNACLEELITTLKTGKPKKKEAKKEGPSAKSLETMVASYRSPLTQQVLQLAAGQKVDMNSLLANDSESYRWKNVKDTIKATCEQLPDGNLRTLLTLIVSGTVDQVKEAIAKCL